MSFLPDNRFRAAHRASEGTFAGGGIAGSGVTFVGIVGLREFRRALRSMDRDLPKLITKANREIVEPVVERARRRYSRLYRSRSGKAKRSIRGLATQTKATVAVGRPRLPYVLGQEFGSNQGPNTRQFPRYLPAPSGRGGLGYFYYPSIREGLQELRAKHYIDALDRAAAQAYPRRLR